MVSFLASVFAPLARSLAHSVVLFPESVTSAGHLFALIDNNMAFEYFASFIIVIAEPARRRHLQ